jgi:hypothetical protein
LTPVIPTLPHGKFYFMCCSLRLETTAIGSHWSLLSLPLRLHLKLLQLLFLVSVRTGAI